ncbi:MAG: hypothetical protein Q9162_004839 [Coniocarpon cinnabarinum]
MATESNQKHPANTASTVKAAKPTRRFFDPWNSSSTGHQRAENRLAGSTSWRESRTRKLRSQFNDSTGGGGSRLADTVGAGSEGFGRDGRTESGGWVKGAPGLRSAAQPSIQESVKLRGEARLSPDGSPLPKRRRIEASIEHASEPQEIKQTMKNAAIINHALPDPIVQKHATSQHRDQSHTYEPSSQGKHQAPETTPSQNKLSQHSSLLSSASTVTTDAGYSPMTNQSARRTNLGRQLRRRSPQTPLLAKPIFRGLNFYINGSTYPTISDHKLKQLIAQHGGSVSLGLARRTVTHVIVGELNRNGGAGGGLAASKIQKEAALGSKGEGVKYIKADWVVECVRRMKRVSESDFQAEGMGTGGARQRSVLGMMKSHER